MHSTKVFRRHTSKKRRSVDDMLARVSFAGRLIVARGFTDSPLALKSALWDSYRLSIVYEVHWLLRAYGIPHYSPLWVCRGSLWNAYGVHHLRPRCRSPHGCLCKRSGPLCLKSEGPSTRGLWLRLVGRRRLLRTRKEWNLQRGMLFFQSASSVLPSTCTT